MKKKILLGVITVFVVFGVIGALSGEPKKEDVVKQEESVTVQEVKEENVFEDFAYYKNNKDRHFQIYTKTKDKNILIEKARTKMWTEGKITVVSFWSTKDDKEVPYLTLAKNEETGIFMNGISNLNPEKLIGVYFKDVFGNETWYKDNLFLKEALTAKELEEIKIK